MPRSKKQKLSKRQKQILILAQWCSLDEIAERLQIGASTEKTHRQRIFRKLKVTSIKEAIMLALLLGWIPLIPPEDLDDITDEGHDLALV